MSLTVTFTPSGVDATAPVITSNAPSPAYLTGAVLSGTLTADEEVTWSKSGPDAALVTLDTVTGAWSLPALDVLVKASYDWTFTATDAASNTDTQQWAFTVSQPSVTRTINLVAVEGDSVSVNYANHYANLYDTGSSDPELIYSYHATGGASLTTIKNRIQDIIDLRPSYVSIYIGTNSLTSWASAQAFYDDLVDNYINVLYAAIDGVRIAVGTLLYHGAGVPSYAAHNARVDLVNPIIRAGEGVDYDACFDFAADPTIGVFSATANAALWGQGTDGQHPTDYAHINFMYPIYAAAMTAMVSETFIDAPVVVNTAGVGNAPSGTIALPANVTGAYLRIQRAEVATKNPDGSYVTPTLDIDYQIQPSDLEEGITNAKLIDDGYTDPGSGAWYQQYRFERDDGSYSAWSNELSGNVTVSTAVWMTASPDKSNWVVAIPDTNGLGMGTNVGTIGAPAGVRANAPPSTTKVHLEIEMSFFNDTRGKISVGFTDALTALGPTATPTVGGNVTTAKGFSLRMEYNSSVVRVSHNGAGLVGTSIVGSPVMADGDVIILELDTATNEIWAWHRAAATGTVSAFNSGNPYTVTSGIPAEWRAYAAGQQGYVASDGDKWIANFGASAFLKTPTSGFTFYA